MFEKIHSAFHKPNTLIYRYVQGTIYGLIVLSILLLFVEFSLPDESLAKTIVIWTDRLLLSIFAVELVLRVGTFRPPALSVFELPPTKKLRVIIIGKLRYLIRPIVLIDILAVLALFPGLRGIRALRLLRLLHTTTFFRYRNPFAIVWLAIEESGLLFAMLFIVITVITILGGVSFYLIENTVNQSVTSIADGLWWALVTITTVGYGDITPVTSVGRVIASFLLVGGMVILALFAGIVGSSLVKHMLSIREEQFRMSDYVNHLVICGYDHSTHLLLDAIKREWNLEENKVVLLDLHERPVDLPTDFLWVQGDPTKESELDKVRLTHAKAVIVTGEKDAAPQVADAQSILTIFTIRSYLKKRHEIISERKNQLYLLAEILDSENVGHAKDAGANEVIETRKIGYSMMAHAVGYHGIASVISGVLITGKHHIYIGNIPPEQENSHTFGDLMASLKLADRGGLVIGIRTLSGEEYINPARSLVIEPNSQLLYLAKSQLLEPPQ